MVYSKKLFSIFIFFIFFDIGETYVLINLKNLQNDIGTNTEYTPEIFIQNLYNKYYGLLDVGYPPQKTEVQFSLNYFGLSFMEDICLTSNYYNKNKSITLSQTYNDEGYTGTKKSILVYESIDFPVFNVSSQQLTYKKINNYKLIYNNTINDPKTEVLDKNTPAKACLMYSFKLSCPRNNDICISIPPFLRKNGLTKSDNFNFIYYNEKEKSTNGGYDAAIIIGEHPHEYNAKKYNEKHYMKTNALKMILELGWIFEFKNYIYLNNGTKISFGVTSLDKKTKGWLLFDLDIIIGVKDYLLYIQPNYFDKHKDQCSFKLVENRYTVFLCDKNFDTKEFPSLYFHSMDLNYIFELKHNELFEIRGDKKYFLIVFDKISNYPWKFGRTFMKKYFFNFETESKQIGFYNNLLLPDDSDEEIDKEKNKYKISFWILFGIIIILLGLGGYFIVYFIKKRNRKKRANELDDDNFEYKQNIKNENLVDNGGEENNKDNLIIN